MKDLSCSDEGPFDDDLIVLPSALANPANDICDAACEGSDSLAMADALDSFANALFDLLERGSLHDCLADVRRFLRKVLESFDEPDQSDERELIQIWSQAVDEKFPPHAFPPDDVTGEAWMGSEYRNN